jgi:hypothetical protein
MQAVKWIGKDGGWKTGQVVRVDGLEIRKIGVRHDFLLIRHSCAGELEFVSESRLEHWADRSEWESPPSSCSSSSTAGRPALHSQAAQ